MAGQLHTWLFRCLQDAARDASNRAETLKEEISELQKEQAEKQSAFDLAHTAIERVDNFQPEIGRELQCPYCWVRDGVHSSLRRLDCKEADWFQCRTCHIEIPVE